MQKLFIVLFISGLISCSTKNDCEKAPNVSNIAVDINVKRLEQELFEIEHKNLAEKFIRNNRSIADNFLQAEDYPNDSVLASQLFKLVNDANVQTLYKETLQEFEDISYLEDQYEQAFRYLRYYYPQSKIPTVATMVTGLGNDLYVSDSLIVIGLDFFIGENATYRPINIPQYILNRYKKEYVVPSSLLLLSSEFNASDPNDHSVLADMIFYGKAYYFTKQMLPCTADSIIIGYTGEQMKDVNNNQATLYAHFIDNQLIYETSPFVKSKYLDERPKTPEIGNKAPGRVGNYLGWKIVQSYMEQNPNISLQELMETTDVQQIFTNSKYKPRNQ